ncbi:MAG: NAD-dependent epimerase/dehydratase family protein, partial [Puniceicoccaceae bacterium]
MNRDAKIYIAGHRGMAGGAVLRKFTALGCPNLVVRERSELDLLSQADTDAFFRREQPEVVV